jgi:ABC-type sugar transport system ATPase subunit
MADRFVLMRDGAVAHRADKSEVSAEELRGLYTRHAENEEPRAEIATRRTSGTGGMA